MTKYLAQQISALADLTAAGVAMSVKLSTALAYNVETGDALPRDEASSITTYGILTSPTKYTRELAPLTMSERVTAGATLASKPVLDAGGELSANAVLRVADRDYKVLGVAAVQPDGVPIIYKVALERM